ncbi:unnamed protein product [Amaranthus hypochondriacus]
MGNTEDHQSSPNPLPHVVILPLPALGHITPMLHLAQLLCIANFKVTFVNTTHNQKRLIRFADIKTRFACYPGFMFETVPDGLPDHHPRTVDGWMDFAEDAANEAAIPVILCRCTSAACNWSYYFTPNLIEAGEIPFKDNDEEMEKLVKNALGMDSFFRYRDLPSFCRHQNESSCRSLHNLFTGEIQRNQRAYALILNTFEDLEGTSLSLIRSHCTKLFCIGPLHAQIKYKLSQQEQTTSFNHSLSSNLWETDRSCISWLDPKPQKSVVYVSFGSLTTLTRDQLTEIWAGLVQSNKYFLWVIRPNLIIGSDTNSSTSDDLLKETEKRGYMVGWAPQEEVLAHPAIGGFLTHSGWNSTLESIVAGVPMLCWPYFADQQVNSRFVGEVWRIGIDMKDTCDRRIVQKMIIALMEGMKEELQKSMDKMSQLAKTSISEGGSSYSNLNNLIEEIKAMST